MQKLKISFILAFIFIFVCTSCLLPFAASLELDENNPIQNEYGPATELLHKIGLIQDIEDFAPDKNISRADFVCLIVKMLKLPLNSGASKQIFFDLPTDHHYSSYIESAYKLGIVDGNQLGYFEPNRQITKTDAITMLIKALGYGEIAQIKGGYPTGYQMLGVDLGLFKSISAAPMLTNSEASQLLFNMGFMERDSVLISGENIKYQIASGKSVFGSLYNIYKGEGIVYSNFLAGLSGSMETTKGRVNIGGEIFEAADTTAQNYLGYNAQYYYRENIGGIKELIVMDFNNNVLIVDAHDVEQYSTDNVSYIDNKGKVKQAKISQYAAHLLNGQHSTSTSIPLEGKFELVDNDLNGLFDVVSVTSYENMIVGHIDTKGQQIFSKTGNYTKLDLLEYEYYDIVDYEDNAIALENLKSNSALSVISCQNKRYAKIVVSDQQADITVTEILIENGYTKLISEKGEGYELSLSLNNPNEMFKLGNKYQLIINGFGKVVGKLSEHWLDMEYGYLVKWILNTESLNGNFLFKIFTIHGEIKIIESAAKIKFNYYDDVQQEMASLIITTQNQLEQMLYDNNVIRYKLNAEGKLSDIEIAGDDKLSKAFRVVGKTSAGDNSTNNRYKVITKTIGGQILVGDDTKVFFIPNDPEAEDSDYTITTSKVFVNDAYYPGAIGYSAKTDSSIAEVVVIGERERVVEGASPIMLFEKLTDSLDGEGNIVKRLYGFSDGGYFSYNVKQGLPLSYKTATGETIPIESGDIIQFVLNSEGSISNFKLLFDASNKRVYGKNDRIDVSPANTTNVGFADESRQAAGYVEARRGNCLYITYDGFTNVSGDTFVMDSAAIYEYNPNATTDTKGKLITLYDVITREEGGNLSDFVFINTRYSEPRIVVIYK